MYKEWLYDRRGGGVDFINQNKGFDHDSGNAKLQINSSSVEVNLPYWHNASTYICIYKAILFVLLLIFTSYNVFTCHMTCFLILLYFVVVNAVINIIHCLLIIVLNLYDRLYRLNSYAIFVCVVKKMGYKIVQMQFQIFFSNYIYLIML